MTDRPPPASGVASVRKGQRLRWLATLTYAVFLTVMSLVPNPAIPKIFDWSQLFSPDKIAHFGAYAVFAVLLSFTLRSPTGWARVAMAVVLAAGFGAAMEVLQSISGTGREFDFADMVANLIGALVGGAAYPPLASFGNKYLASVGW